MWELAKVFLTLGTIAFGGPAAHIAMMEDEVVRRRAWLTRDAFLDYVGATNLIPGPNSTELAIHIGYVRGGWKGLVVAGTCFVLPATLIVGVIAWAYVRFGALPQATALLYGVKPVVIAVVLQALWGLGRTAVKSSALGLVALVSATAVALGVNELLVLAGAAIAMALVRVARAGSASRAALVGLAGMQPRRGVLTSLLAGTGAVGGIAAAVTVPTLLGIFGVFMKIGAVLFGSGYVLLAFLRADLVERLGWLSERQLLDAVAVGQVTPGPLFTTATFVGYLLHGTGGAIAATAGIFLPAFVFVALSGPLLPVLRRSPTAGAMLDGINAASLALMAVVTVHLARTALIDATTVAVGVASAALLLRFRVNSAWLVIGGACAGLISSVVR
jgi:chromate transporter